MNNKDILKKPLDFNTKEIREAYKLGAKQMNNKEEYIKATEGRTFASTMNNKDIENWGKEFNEVTKNFRIFNDKGVETSNEILDFIQEQLEQRDQYWKNKIEEVIKEEFYKLEEIEKAFEINQEIIRTRNNIILKIINTKL